MSKKYRTTTNIDNVFGLGVICGIGSVINIAGDFNVNEHKTITGYQRDLDAIGDDFNMIGQDFNNTINLNGNRICQNTSKRTLLKNN